MLLDGIETQETRTEIGYEFEEMQQPALKRMIYDHEPMSVFV
jgi:hypothetical protein